MNRRETVIAWRDSDEWATEMFGLQPRSNSRLTIGFYLLVPVTSEAEGLALAKKLASQDSISEPCRYCDDAGKVDGEVCQVCLGTRRMPKHATSAEVRK